ncbi:MAG: radical SAM protein [Anaerolineales bacterium]|jgi:pyruvate formate-lyase activating enzyme-like uncharacterized protein
MIIGVDRTTLPKIKNPDFRVYAGKYVDIYDDFMEQITQMGLEVDPHDYSEVVNEKIDRLHQKGAIVRNDDKSIYINSISPSCVACRKGIGSATYFISLQCHRDCFYCFNPNQEGYEIFSKNELDLVTELESIFKKGAKLKHLALTGGEPLLHKEDTIAFFRTAQQKFPSAYTRLYTSGDHLNAQTLEELSDAGLHEIRISIRMHDLERGNRHTFDMLSLSKKYIPTVMVEMPILPSTFEEMKKVLKDLELIGIFGINLLEFCFPFTNAETFRQRGYKIKYPPYRVLYNYWYAGGLPIAGSEIDCLNLLEFAIDEGLGIGVHYCSLENKHTGQIYQLNVNHDPPKALFFSKKDFFLKSAKVFGEDIPLVINTLKNVKRAKFTTNQEHNFLEFHVRNIKSLAELDVEVGISSNVMESREDGTYLRELKVDLCYPKVFNFSTDV